MEPAKEAYRDRGTIPLFENLRRDVGICSSVAIVAFVDATLIKPCRTAGGPV
ncbi:MAG: hypothetical protein ACLP59_05745 [Bryobacteraceae bacterium]